MSEASNLRKSRSLQTWFSQANMDVMHEQADMTIDLDNVDADSLVDELLRGVDKGVELAYRLEVVRKLPGNEDAGIYLCTYDHYGDGDGIALFVGTEKNLMEMFKANPAED